MKDRLLTILLSVITTCVVMNLMQSGRLPSRQALVPAVQAAQTSAKPLKELIVDRLIVRNELIVSDTGKPWDDGFEKQMIPRGMVARSLVGGPRAAGIWVRGRLIKAEIDDPFDDRFHAMNRDGSMFDMPGHISWNVWLGDNWRQLAIIQGEKMEYSEMPKEEWSGGNHPGRLRFQTFRPNHDEPLTDAIIGQGMMSLGGGGFGGSGLQYPSEVLQLWGGKIQLNALSKPQAPSILRDDKSGTHTYALIAVGPQGDRGEPSPAVTAQGLAALAWDSVLGADAYIILRDGQPIGPMRMEGSEKHWTDTPSTN
jgi:hypothetical protein